MKIGIDARLWNETGVGRYIRNLVRELQKIDTKNQYVLFCLSKDAKEILRSAQDDNFKIVTADIRWHSLREQMEFPKIISAQKLDLVHFTYFSVPLLYKGPFVLTIHDLIIHHFNTGEASTLPNFLYTSKRIGYKFIIQTASIRAKKIITVSLATKEEIVAHLKVLPEKVEVTYEGIDEELILKSSNKPASVPDDFILYVGNAYPHKNLKTLIDAFSILISKNQKLKTKLILVGKDDFFYKRLKSDFSKSIHERIIFFHDISDRELAYLYQNARCYVMPSLMEGFGLPLVEAMSNECLVLASNIPVHHEICRDAAIYFDPTNVKELKLKMEEVCIKNDNQFSEYKKVGFKRAKDFSWRTMAEKTLHMYEEVFEK